MISSTRMIKTESSLFLAPQIGFIQDHPLLLIVALGGGVSHSIKVHYGFIETE